ncbi:MAG: dephospho-CoA kinase [Lachnospiraceae bacterium]|nr:dephospho-CoA kinase [Lachnospiraceae bacterium]
MITIGVTGGVGAGKSVVMDYLEKAYNAAVIKADEAAHLLEEPGQDCYNELLDIFGKSILDENGFIDRKAFATMLFSDPEARTKTNACIHPAVKKYVLKRIAQEEAKRTTYFALEAALLIEEHYDELLDRMWYVYVPEDIRRRRLKENRGYSDEKIDNIFASQLSEEEFRSHCNEVIFNGGSPEETYREIDAIMKRYLMEGYL